MGNKYLSIYFFSLIFFVINSEVTKAQIPFELRNTHTGKTVKFKKGRIINMYNANNTIAKNTMVIALKNDTITLADSSKIAITDIYAISTYSTYVQSGSIAFFATGALLSVAGYLTLKANHPYLFLIGGIFWGGSIPVYLFLYQTTNSEGRNNVHKTYYMTEYQIIKTSETNIFERGIR